MTPEVSRNKLKQAATIKGSENLNTATLASYLRADVPISSTTERAKNKITGIIADRSIEEDDGYSLQKPLYQAIAPVIDQLSPEMRKAVLSYCYDIKYEDSRAGYIEELGIYDLPNLTPEHIQALHVCYGSNNWNNRAMPKSFAKMLGNAEGMKSMEPEAVDAFVRSSIHKNKIFREHIPEGIALNEFTKEDFKIIRRFLYNVHGGTETRKAFIAQYLDPKTCKNMSREEFIAHLEVVTENEDFKGLMNYTLGGRVFSCETELIERLVAGKYPDFVTGAREYLAEIEQSIEDQKKSKQATA